MMIQCRKWLGAIGLVSALGLVGCAGGGQQGEEPLDSEEVDLEGESQSENSNQDSNSQNSDQNYDQSNDQSNDQSDNQSNDQSDDQSNDQSNDEDDNNNDSDNESNQGLNQDNDQDQFSNLQQLSNQQQNNMNLSEEGSQGMDQTAQNVMNVQNGQGISTERGFAGVSAALGLPELGSKMAYIVRKGDSLSAISKKIFGNFGKWKQLAEASHIDTPNLIYPGEVIYYQLTQESLAFAMNYENMPRAETLVMAGESLPSVAQRVYGDSSEWKHLWRHNDHITNLINLDAGTTIYYVKKDTVAQRSPKGQQANALLSMRI